MLSKEVAVLTSPVVGLGTALDRGGGVEVEGGGGFGGRAIGPGHWLVGPGHGLVDGLGGGGGGSGDRGVGGLGLVDRAIGGGGSGIGLGAVGGLGLVHRAISGLGRLVGGGFIGGLGLVGGRRVVRVGVGLTLVPDVGHEARLTISHFVSHNLLPTIGQDHLKSRSNQDPD